MGRAPPSWVALLLHGLRSSSIDPAPLRSIWQFLGCSRPSAVDLANPRALSPLRGGSRPSAGKRAPPWRSSLRRGEARSFMPGEHTRRRTSLLGAERARRAVNVLARRWVATLGG